MKKENHYEYYHFTVMEFITVILKSVVLLITISYLFYRSAIAILILSPFILLCIKEKRESQKRKRLEILQSEFREAILAVSSALNAGYSVENAFSIAYKDMQVLYGENGMIVSELYTLIHKVSMNILIEDALEEFARRSGLEDIKNFTEIFVTAKRIGGDMNAVIKSTAIAISEKIEVKKEISVIISGKKFEQKIMNYIPLGIMLYIDITSPDFFSVLYRNPLGIVIMTVSLAIYAVAYYISKRIVEIEV